MWRDPLDELIDDLERVAPDPREAAGLPIEVLQAVIDAVLDGTPADIKRQMAHPAYQRWRARVSGDEKVGKPDGSTLEPAGTTLELDAADPHLETGRHPGHEILPHAALPKKRPGVERSH